MNTVEEFHTYISSIQPQIDGLTFFLFDRFYSRMCLEYGGNLTLEEIRKKILKEMLDLAGEEYSLEICHKYEAKNSDLEEIQIFSKLTKSIFKK